MGVRSKCEVCGCELPVRSGRGRPRVHCGSDCRRFAGAVVTVAKLADRIVDGAPSSSRGRAVARVRRMVQSMELPTGRQT